MPIISFRVTAEVHEALIKLAETREETLTQLMQYAAGRIVETTQKPPLTPFAARPLTPIYPSEEIHQATRLSNALRRVPPNQPFQGTTALGEPLAGVKVGSRLKAEKKGKP